MPFDMADDTHQTASLHDPGYGTNIQRRVRKIRFCEVNDGRVGAGYKVLYNTVDK